MKTSNSLIKITNLDTGEFRYFTKDSYVQAWTGCSVTALLQIRGNKSLKYSKYKYEIIDGSEILWKDINIV